MDKSEVITIENQTWFLENLNVEKFQNGDSIAHAITNKEWVSAKDNKQPAWCYYNNDPANGSKYGKLYNWYAVNDPRGLAPEGSIIPSVKEWDLLTMFLGGENIAGGKIKAMDGWRGNDNGTNEIGFSAMPCGYRTGKGMFEKENEWCYFWSSSVDNSECAWSIFLRYNNDDVEKDSNLKSLGFSVRCLRSEIKEKNKKNNTHNQISNKNNSLKIRSLTFIEDKLNFKFYELEKYEIDLLKNNLGKLEILIDNFDEFFKYFIQGNVHFKVKIFTKEEVNNISKQIKSNDVFGQLESGWIIGKEGVYFCLDDDRILSLSYEEMLDVEWKKVNLLFKTTCSFKYPYGDYIGIDCDLIENHKLFFKEINNTRISWIRDIRIIKLEIQNEIDFKIKNNLSLAKNKYILDFGKDSNGDINLVENAFHELLIKNQKNILEIDRDYIKKFVKVSNFIKTKKENTKKIFESINDISTQEELEERILLLKNQIHSYELLVFHSTNMIGALVSEDLITFYEIYEALDKLNIFNSNWENEVSDKLTNIGNKLDDLLYSINKMEQNIVSRLMDLNYVFQDSFELLNKSVSSQLREIESSINTNNLLAGIQAYQLYKINRNTKRLNS